MNDSAFYFVTKYALTEGVLMIPREDTTLFADGTAIKWGRWFASAHGKGKEWHETRESAEKQVEHLKAKKMISLQKSIAKLSKPTKFKELPKEQQ